MRKFALAVLIAVIVSGGLFHVRAENSLQSFLDAPVWYLQYDVTFKVATANTLNEAPIVTRYSVKMERKLAGSAKLDIRIPGPCQALSLASSLSAAEQMKFVQEMMTRMETAANWMTGGEAPEVDENASDAELQAAALANMEAMMYPASLDYVRLDSISGLVNEMGQPFKKIELTTRKGAGPVLPTSGSGFLLEIDVPSKSFAVTIPYSFNGMNSKMTVDCVTTVTDVAGNNPDVQRNSNELSLHFFPNNLALDDPKVDFAGAAIVRGELNPTSGKIAGERSFAAHYTDAQLTVPGTVTIRYALTLTPPVKGK